MARCRRNLLVAAVALGAIACLRCSHDLAPDYSGVPPGLAPYSVAQNPVFVPAADRDFVWNQVVDALDEHFRIEREERVRLIGGVLTEGRIDTYPTVGSTILEPWRSDSTPGFERHHATLQTVRRRAMARVTPVEGGFLVAVEVFKELEEVDRPERSNVAVASIRHDGSLSSDRERGPGGAITLGWIPLGRDVSLEQRILTDIRSRLTDAGAPVRLPQAPTAD